LVEGVDATAKAMGVSRSEFVSEAIGQRLTRQAGAVLMRQSGSGRFAGWGESTSKKVASAAAKVLKSKSASKAEKSVAASALTQKGSKETTSAKVAKSASQIMHDPKASKAAKSAAASALTQKVKKK
jgi:hypothetical protein